MKSKLNIQKALMQAGYNGGGAIAAASVNKIEFVGKLKPVIRGGAKLAIGALIPSLLKGKKNEAIEGAVAGWNAIAALELANGILTKNGAEPTKAISIAGIGDVNPNIMGVADAEYTLSDGPGSDDDENMF
jgi:hypothetical protein